MTLQYNEMLFFTLTSRPEAKTMCSFLSHFRSVCVLLVFVAVATSASSQGETTQDSLFTHFSLAVYDYNTGVPLDSAKVEVQSSTQTFILYTDMEGQVRFDFCCDKVLDLDLSVEDHIGIHDVFHKENEEQTINKEYFLKEANFCTLTCPQIFFECNSIRMFDYEDFYGENELEACIQLIKILPERDFQLNAFVSSQENKNDPNLGLRRINFCMDYLVKNGVNEFRVAVGTVEIVPCSNLNESDEDENGCCQPMNRKVYLELKIED